MRNAMSEPQDQECQLALPMCVATSSLSSRIFNALIEQMGALGLGWRSPMDVSNDGIGTVMIKVLSEALAYLMPFEINGSLLIPKHLRPTSWVRVTAVWRCHPAADLTMSVCTPPCLQQVTVSYRNMRSATKLSLDAETLLDHAAALASVVEVVFESQWGSLDMWNQFIASVHKLSVSLDVLWL